MHFSIVPPPQHSPLHPHNLIDVVHRYHKLSEMWISEHPPLLGLYINTYAPWLGRELMIRLFGPARIKALKQGTDLFNFKVGGEGGVNTEHGLTWVEVEG